MTTPLVARPRAWFRSLGSKRVRATLVIILLVGGGARAAWVAHAGVHPGFASDPEAYLLQGETIARGEGYANALVDIENVTRREHHEALLAPEPASFYPPGYPVFVAAVTWTVWHTPIPDGDLVRTIEYVQVLLGMLTILMVFLLARRAFGPRTGLIAAAIVAVYPNLVATTATLQFETFFVALLLLAAVVLLPSATRDDPGVVRMVVSGGLIGAGALVNPPIGLLLLAFLVVRLTLRRPWRETVRDFAIITAAVVVCIAPWTIRNAVRLHAFVPFATGAGPALCMSRNPEATGSIDLTILDRECRPKQVASSFAQQEVAVNRYATSHAVRWVAHHPFSELQMWWRRTDLAFRTDTSGLDAYAANMTNGSRRAADTLFDAASLVVLALAAIGAALTIARRRRAASIYVVASTAAFAAVPIILFGDPRYRVPDEPFLAVLAAVALGAAVAKLGAARPQSQRDP